jgi:hypothetical protein
MWRGAADGKVVMCICSSDGEIGTRMVFSL